MIMRKVGKGVKIITVVDARGLPIAVDTASTQPHETKLIHGLFEFMLTDEKPELIIGDKAYDSDVLVEAMGNVGIEMIAPQDGRKLRRYKKRLIVERTISWLQNFRRLRIRWEKSTKPL